jgi:predicted ATPase
MLSKYDESENSNPIDFYRDKILKEIEKDFKNIPSIVQFKDNSRKDYSDGVNAHVYFDIISSNIYQKGIYLIDQPEDDVSPAAIKKYLLKDFKCMGKDRQILLITHNPQFVVNLDVDNIICITKNDEKEIKIISGALEYKDQEVDIIKTVAETLEGGIESIKKRWKRYEKNSDN